MAGSHSGAPDGARDAKAEGVAQEGEDEGELFTGGEGLGFKAQDKEPLAEAFHGYRGDRSAGVDGGR